MTCTTTLAMAATLVALAASAAAQSEAPPLWQLTSLNGKANAVEVTLSFGDDGSVFGSSGCNRYTGRVNVAPPAFGLDQVAGTKMACPEMDTEKAYLEALSKADRIEETDTTLILSGPEGVQLVFSPAE